MSGCSEMASPHVANVLLPVRIRSSARREKTNPEVESDHFMYRGNHRKPKGRHRGSVKQKAKRIVVSTIIAGTMIVIPSSLPIPATAGSALGREAIVASMIDLRDEKVIEVSRSSQRETVAASLVAPEKPKVLNETIGVHDVKAVANPTPTVVAAPAPVAAAPAPAPAPVYSGTINPGSCQIGVVANAQAMCEAVYANFPVNSIGGYRAGSWGDHPTGHALDIMVGAYNPVGDSIADWAIANSGTYGVKYIIWRQRTWWPDSGWGPIMANRGSLTANHYDHVHVSFY